MRYQNPEKMSIIGGILFYGERPISLNGFRYAYISGANSDTEYRDNLGCYSVSIKVAHDSYVILETQNKAEAKKKLKEIKALLPKSDSIKMYNNSAIVNLKNVLDVKLSDSKKENGSKVKIHMDNGRILRVYRSAFETPAKIYLSTVVADLKNYIKRTM